jgi:hypothetical protein
VGNGIGSNANIAQRKKRIVISQFGWQGNPADKKAGQRLSAKNLSR